jgi:hypothetical protein
MSEWTPEKPAQSRPQLASSLVEEMERNDSAYLALEIDRDKWIETARGIDERLAVIGLRIAVRPWRDQR